MAKWRDIKQGKKIPKKDDLKKEINLSFEPCASISSRVKAFLTDTFLITTPIFYVIIYFIMGGGDAFAQERVTGWLLILVLHLTVILFFWLSKSQTPGLKAYSLKIINAKTKDKITFTQALIRYMATLFSVISLFLLFVPFFREDKRTFQDLFSNTYIIDQE